jgi:hypothetical protein
VIAFGRTSPSEVPSRLCATRSASTDPNKLPSVRSHLLRLPRGKYAKLAGLSSEAGMAKGVPFGTLGCRCLRARSHLHHLLAALRSDQDTPPMSARGPSVAPLVEEPLQLGVFSGSHHHLDGPLDVG